APFVPVAWAVVEGLPWARERAGRAAGVARLAAGAAALVACSALAAARTRVWVSDESLWRDIVAKAPDSPRAHGNYGDSLMYANKMREAEPHLREAIRLSPAYPYALLMMGHWIALVGDTTAASVYLDRSIASDPNLFYAYYYRGLACEELKAAPADGM